MIEMSRERRFASLTGTSEHRISWFNGEAGSLSASGPAVSRRGTAAVSIRAQRKDHNRSCLLEEDVDPDPIRQFMAWYDEASQSGVAESNALALATAAPDGRPSVRMVLLRGIDARGFTFFTNYESRKARELEANPRAAIVFFWHEHERQVRAEGEVERTSSAESDDYFRTRPKGAQLGARASPQSEVLAGREVLDAEFHRLENRYQDDAVPRLANWGGYRLVPQSIEFWQGRPNRLHDRLRYTRRPEGGWLIDRLAP
jgi:pyridoxamine 5'-phosphate oxidase